MSYSAGPQSHARGAKIPCWPNPSPLTILFTRDLNRFIYWFAYPRMLILFALLFIFNRQIDPVLGFFGYKPDVVSFFPFLRALYAHLTSTVGNGNISTAYFHVLDASLWMTLAVWGTRLMGGLLFLRQYDDFYGRVSLRIARTPRGRRYFVFLWSILFCLTPIFITWVLMQPRTINDPEIVAIVNWLPMAYFYALAVTYFCCANCFVEISLFLFWKIRRQKRPEVVLWQ